MHRRTVKHMMKQYHTVINIAVNLFILDFKSAFLIMIDPLSFPYFYFPRSETSSLNLPPNPNLPPCLTNNPLIKPNPILKPTPFPKTYSPKPTCFPKPTQPLPQIFPSPNSPNP